MKLVDANILLYAVDTSAPHHAQARHWLDTALSGAETVILPWLCLLAFLRISTHPGIYPRPLTAEQATRVVSAWTHQPNVVPGAPTSQHAELLGRMLAATGVGGSVGGNLVNDAHLAALAIEHSATVVTFDSDFGRFPGVSWEPPAAG